MRNEREAHWSMCPHESTCNQGRWCLGDCAQMGVGSECTLRAPISAWILPSILLLSILFVCGIVVIAWYLS